jgi:hypothetical protein
MAALFSPSFAIHKIRLPESDTCETSSHREMLAMRALFPISR